MRGAGFAIGNVDATIVVERLGQFIETMRANVASCLGIAVDVVSVKAKTSDGMGTPETAAASPSTPSLHFHSEPC